MSRDEVLTLKKEKQLKPRLDICIHKKCCIKKMEYSTIPKAEACAFKEKRHFGVAMTTCLVKFVYS